MSDANLDVKGESIDEERNEEESACEEEGCSEEKEVAQQDVSSSIPAPRNRGRFYFVRVFSRSNQIPLPFQTPSRLPWFTPGGRQCSLPHVVTAWRLKTPNARTLPASLC